MSSIILLIIDYIINMMTLVIKGASFFWLSFIGMIPPLEVIETAEEITRFLEHALIRSLTLHNHAQQISALEPIRGGRMFVDAGGVLVDAANVVYGKTGVDAETLTRADLYHSVGENYIQKGKALIDANTVDE